MNRVRLIKRSCDTVSDIVQCGEIAPRELGCDDAIQAFLAGDDEHALPDLPGIGELERLGPAKARRHPRWRQPGLQQADPVPDCKMETLTNARQRRVNLRQHPGRRIEQEQRAQQPWRVEVEPRPPVWLPVWRQRSNEDEAAHAIREAIQTIRSISHSIQHSTESHSAASESVSEAVTRILEFAQHKRA